MTSVEPQVQDKNQNATETQPSGEKRKLANENIQETPTKYMRFELEDKNDTTSWDLPSGFVSFLYKYILYILYLRKKQTWQSLELESSSTKYKVSRKLFFSIDILLHIHLSNKKHYHQVQIYWEYLGKI